MVLVNPTLQSDKRIKKKTRFFKITEEERKMSDEFDKKTKTDKAFCTYIENQIEIAREEIARGEYYTTAEFLAELEEEYKNYE